MTYWKCIPGQWISYQVFKPLHESKSMIFYGQIDKLNQQKNQIVLNHRFTSYDGGKTMVNAPLGKSHRALKYNPGAINTINIIPELLVRML